MTKKLVKMEKKYKTMGIKSRHTKTKRRIQHERKLRKKSHCYEDVEMKKKRQSGKKVKGKISYMKINETKYVN